jgi:hypothetical protein
MGRQPSFETIYNALPELSRDELHVLAERINELLAEEAGEDEVLETAGSPRTGGNGGGKGWVELKLIRGYGPYAYRRWREGGVLRSEYVGKVKDE